MVGAILGGVASLAGGVIGAVSARKAAKKQEEELKKREQRQAATYARRANQDYTQRADAQRMLRMTSDILKERQAAAAGRQAVMGVTDSGMAAEREVAEKVLTDTAAELAAAGEAEKKAAENTYQAQQDANAQERVNIATNRAQAVGQAVGQAVQGAASIASSVGMPTRSGLKIPKGAGNIPKPTMTPLNEELKIPKTGINLSNIKI